MSGLVPRQEGEWKVLRAPLPARPQPAPAAEALLRWNAWLTGAAMFALEPSLAAELRAEVPDPGLPTEVDLRWSEESLAGLDEGLAWWEAAAGPEACAPLPALAPLPPAFGDLCSAAGWSLSVPAEGVPQVNSGAGEAPCAVRCYAEPERLRLVVELAEVTTAAPESVAAIALFLLHSARRLRWARPALRAAEGRELAVLELSLPAVPTAEYVEKALGCLAVGTRCFGPGVRELLHAPIARDFLAIARS